MKRIVEADSLSGLTFVQYGAGVTTISNYNVWSCRLCGGFFIHPVKSIPARCPFCKETR